MIKKIVNLGLINGLSQGFYRGAILIVFMQATSSSLDEFALNSTLIMLFTVFQSLGTAGLTLAANTFIPKFEDFKNIYTKVIINISLFAASIISFLVYLLIDYLLPLILVDSLDLPSYKYLSLFVLILCLSGVFKGFFYAEDKYYNLAVVSLFSGTMLLLSFFITNLNLLQSYLISVAIEFIILLFFLIRFLEIKKIIKIKVKRKYYEEVFAFIIPASVSGLILMPTNIVILYILGLFNSSLLISIFNYGMQIRNLIIFIPSILGAIFLKILSTSTNGSRDIRWMIIINFMLSLLISLTLIFLKILDFKYMKIISLMDMVLLCLSCILFSINSVVGNKIVSELKTRVGLVFNIAWALTFISFTYFSYLLNIQSAFIGLLCSYILLTFIQVNYLRKS